MRNICVIDPAIETPELESYNQIALSATLPTTYHLPVLHGIRSLEILDQTSIAGIIILGSSCSVNDDLDWQLPLYNYLQPLLEGGTPTLGICFGHQMIAYMFGATIDFITADQHKFRGARLIKISATGPFAQSQEKLLISHNEQVVDVPKGFSIFATSDEIKIDGLVHDRLPIYTFQTHPEATTAFIEDRKIDPTLAIHLTHGKSIIESFLHSLDGSVEK